MMVRSFEELECWRHSRKLNKLLFQISKDRKFSSYSFLRKQLLNSGINIMKNISLGFGVNDHLEFKEYLEKARSSAYSVKSLSYIMLDLSLIGNTLFEKLKNQLKELILTISGLINFLDKAKLMSI